MFAPKHDLLSKFELGKKMTSNIDLNDDRWEFRFEGKTSQEIQATQAAI